jgi:hypothetical protein
MTELAAFSEISKNLKVSSFQKYFFNIFESYKIKNIKTIAVRKKVLIFIFETVKYHPISGETFPLTVEYLGGANYWLQD